MYHNTEPQQWVNDYLDLYLYAGKIGDRSWQQEILTKLINSSTNQLSRSTLTH